MFLTKPKNYLNGPPQKSAKPPQQQTDSPMSLQKIKVKFGSNLVVGTLNMRRSTKLALKFPTDDRSVKIGLLPLDDIQGKGAQRVSTMIRHSKALAKLNVKFSGIIAKYSKKLFTSFREKRTMKKLVLDFNDASGFNTRCSESLLAGLRNLSSLSFLQIIFWQGITNQSLINFSLGLRKMYSLSVMILNLNKGCYTDSFAANVFFCCLKRLRSLSVLQLDFGSKLVNVDLQSLGEALSQLAPLTSLTLNFDYNFQITSKALESLASGLLIRRCTRNAKILKTLELSFMNCRGMCDKGLSALGGYLSKSFEIVNLKLNFSRCKKITNKGVEALAKGIVGLPLMSLDLRFDACQHIKNSGLEKLADIIKDLSSDCFISLDFTDCQKISEEMKKSFRLSLKGKNTACLDGKRVIFSGAT